MTTCCTRLVKMMKLSELKDAIPTPLTLLCAAIIGLSLYLLVVNG